MNEEQLSRNGPDHRLPSILSSFFIGLASQVLVIAAVLYYVGWLKTQNYYNYFNIDISLLGFSATDYMLNSVNIVFPALVLITLGVIAALGINSVISAIFSRFQWMQIPLLIALILGALFLTAWSLARIRVEHNPGNLFTIWTPVILLFGCILFLYFLRAVDIRGSSFSSRGVRRLLSQVTLFLVVIATLWTLSLYGGWMGNRDAESLAHKIGTSPSVALYTTQRLAINGPAVNVAEITQTGTKYRFQYTGMKLLARSGDRLFLIAARWQKNRDSAYVLHDNDDLRADVTAG